MGTTFSADVYSTAPQTPARDNMYFYLNFDPQIGCKIKRNRKASAWYLLLGGQGGLGSVPGTILDSPKTLQKDPKRLLRESKDSQEAPKGFQEAPKRVKRVPRSSKRLPRAFLTDLFERLDF